MVSIYDEHERLLASNVMPALHPPHLSGGWPPPPSNYRPSPPILPPRDGFGGPRDHFGEPPDGRHHPPDTFSPFELDGRETHDLRRDWRLTPLSLVVVLLELERAAALELPCEELSGVRTVADLVTKFRAWVHQSDAHTQRGALSAGER